MTKPIEEFNKAGFPIIKLFDDYFEIKDVDYWEFRKFQYNEILKLKYNKPANSWWYKLLFTGFITTYLRPSLKEPYYLKIFLKNGGDWTYKCSSKRDLTFSKILRQIDNKISLRDT